MFLVFGVFFLFILKLHVKGVGVTQCIFQEFVFEIVVDKKLVPKEVLETGG